MKGALEMQELNYVAFENEFVKFCSGDIDTELEYGGKVKPTRENIDRYILLPAAMTKDEKEKHLVFNEAIDKTALSKFRKGERPVPKAVVAAFKKDGAVGIAVERFIKIIPEVNMEYYSNRCIYPGGSVYNSRVFGKKFRNINWKRKSGRSMFISSYRTKVCNTERNTYQEYA